MPHSRDRPEDHRITDSDAEPRRRVPVTHRNFERAGTAYQDEKFAGRTVRVGRTELVDRPAGDLNAPTTLRPPIRQECP